MKVKDCTLGQKHKWAWIKNVNKTEITTQWTRFNLKGQYRCLCGSQKIGQPGHGQDLRELVNNIRSAA